MENIMYGPIRCEIQGCLESIFKKSTESLDSMGKIQAYVRYYFYPENEQFYRSGNVFAWCLGSYARPVQAVARGLTGQNFQETIKGIEKVAKSVEETLVTAKSLVKTFNNEKNLKEINAKVQVLREKVKFAETGLIALKTTYAKKTNKAPFIDTAFEDFQKKVNDAFADYEAFYKKVTLVS